MQLNPKTVFSDFTSFFPMVWAIVRGKYKMPWSTLFWAVLCVIYLISPIDVIPDVLPALGITDDGAFVLFILSLLHKDLVAFRQEKSEKENIIEAEVIKTEEKDK